MQDKKRAGIGTHGAGMAAPGITAPSITLPKGGGGIRGVGEKFAANPVTGTGSMVVPIFTSPGRSKFNPQLSLSYDSGSGNGPFGFGWSLSVPAVTRKTDKGIPLYNDAEESDVFILSGAEDLVPVLEQKAGGGWVTQQIPPRTVDGTSYSITQYLPRTEGLFSRIERWTSRSSRKDYFWRTITKDNITAWYGGSPESRIADPADPTRIFSWLICSSYDDKGNAIAYEYAAENGENVDSAQTCERNRVRMANRYLKRIRYGNRASHRDTATWKATDPVQLPKDTWMFEVLFDYDEAHYHEIDFDPAKPAEEQHRFVLASALPGPAWDAGGRGWAVRPDPFSSHRSGFEVRTYRRCRRVLMFHHIPDLPTGEKGYDGLVRSTEFDYADLDYRQPVAIDAELTHQGSTRFASFLRAVTQSGYVLDDTLPVVVRNGIPYGTYLKQSLPPIEFQYSKAAIQDRTLTLDAESLENLPAGLDGSTYRFVDLDGEGVSGILAEQSGAWFYKPNLGDGRFGPLQAVAAQPSGAAMGSGRQQFLDLAGDGQLDLVAFADCAPGFYERTLDQGWTPFRPFRRLPTIPWGAPNLRFVDLNGDGHADVLMTEQDVFTWHPSLAEEGFGPARQVRQSLDEESGPRLVFADGTQSIYLADMCGDGLTDLVRIRNGEVCYWPSLGYGHFGAKVTMDNAPWFDNPDQFDQSRVRLADIDGSGTCDIIYLATDGVRLYFNQSGNRMSEPRKLVQSPPVDNVSSIVTADLLGNGTACLVWSSPGAADARRPLRYIDLMGGTKPHLLIRSVNNLGAETEVHYEPSTRFYLADKRGGRPWITRLPFPVHVVERVITRDRISGNQFVSRYAYHHGYFDGIEREYRGFGMVEQWDTEEFAALHADGRPPAGSNIESSSHIPPVLTRTWFHTGVYETADQVSRHFAAEYYGAPERSDPNYDASFSVFFQTLLPDTVIPPGLTADEEREACRALKGSVLRQEVYALDGTDEERHPYTVTEQNFTIRALQPRGANRHAVFLTHARESIVYHFERDPADPRVGHVLTLEADRYGNVLKSATVGYGRRRTIRVIDAQGNTTEMPNPGLHTLDPRDQAKQVQILVTYTENRVTVDHDTGREAIDQDDEYRAPLPCELRTYELTGMTLAAGSDRFTFDEVLAAGAQAAAISYEKSSTAGLTEKRLIEHVRTYYCRNDLAGPLPLGKLQSLALPFESYKLAFTPGLVAQIYGSRVSDAMLRDEGRYVHTEGDLNWWIPTGRIFYSPDPTDTPAQELAHARQHFFLPNRYRDPFHTDAVSTESIVSYDAYDLLVHGTVDALGNRVTSGERRLVLPDGAVLPEKRCCDYRVLLPALIMDPNRNCSETRFDALGMVVGLAVMGKPEEDPRPGDRLTAAFRADLTQAETDRFFANPKGPMAAALLDGATSRVVYDLRAYLRETDPAPKPPAVAATLVRETHVSEQTPTGTLRLQASFSYSDGFGREIQKKIPAEPGPVPARDAAGTIIVDTDGQPQMTPDDVSPRWVGSGWTVFNNKGKPVRQYEPFFTETHRFEFDARVGVSPVLFYDPAQRVVGTLYPDHTWEKDIYHPWHQEVNDVNDTVLTADPGADKDLGGSLSRLPAEDYLPTWYGLRTDAANAAALAARYPDPKDRANEARAAEKSLLHAATPTVAHSDSLGRPFLTVAHNKYRYSDAPAATPTEEFQATRVTLDIEGNQRELTDAKDRIVQRYGYDMLGNRAYQSSMEAGERWMLNDAACKPLYSWDGRDQRFRTAYDPLRRPTELFLRREDGGEITVELSVYGESRPDPESANLRGMVAERRDQAGVLTNDAYDFKGNLLQSRRQLADLVDPEGARTPAHRTTVGWNGDVQLSAETFTGRTRYDALNRPIMLIAPHSDQPGTKVSLIQPSYNEANLLEQVMAWPNENAEPDGLLDPATANLRAVTDIEYDARGRRTRIDYGTKDGKVIRTSYTYNRRTFRLTHLYTRRGVAPGTGQGVSFTEDCDNPHPPPPAIAAPEVPPQDKSCGLQNIHFTYDPMGNVTHIRDAAQQTVYFKNQLVEPSSEYAYDALYRLIEAGGREHLGQAGGAPIAHSYNDAPRASIPHPGDGTAMGRYLERYTYDTVGNLLSLQHRGSDPAQAGWTRSYTYNEPSSLEAGKQSNRLTSTDIGGTTEKYSVAGDGYDAHGNLLHMPHLQLMQWNFRDFLQMTQRQAVNGTDAEGVEHAGERTWYVYDSGGQRVRKVTELATGQIKDEWIYLGGLEIYRRKGLTPLTRETLHLMDGGQRIATMETRTQGAEPGVPPQLVRYPFGNHLGSASLELDDGAAIISYEEYTPYGSTSYQAVRSQTETPKRYRYTGRERDAESGLYYHGARYYASWLARWTSCDPLGVSDSTNLYEYVSCRPTVLIDPGGQEGETPPPNSPKEVLQFEARQAAFEAGKKLERGEVKATRGGKELPPPKGDQLKKLIGNSKQAKELRLKYATKQGVETGQILKENITARSAAAASGTKEVPHFGEASQKLVPEVAFDKGKVLSAGKNPGGEPKGARTADVAIAQEPTPPSQYGSLKGQKGGAAFESAADLKLGAGRVADKPGFTKASGGLSVEEVAPGTKGLRLPKTAGTTLNAAGGALIVLDAMQMARDQRMAEQGFAGRAGLAVLEDEKGEYTLQIQHGIIFNDYSKTYISGPMKGTTVELGFFEFYREVKKRDEKYGYFDWKGDLVSGKVAPIYVPAPPPDMI